MSIGFIAAQSIFDCNSSKRKHKKVSKRGLTVRGGVKKPMDIATTRLMNGTVKKRMHYQVTQHALVTTVTGKRIVIGDQRTYSEEIKRHLELEKANPAPKKEAGVHAARETCKRLESVEKPIKFDKFGFQKKQNVNGRRVQKHGANTVFK